MSHDAVDHPQVDEDDCTVVGHRRRDCRSDCHHQRNARQRVIKK
jgi:hypothetical protein